MGWTHIYTIHTRSANVRNGWKWHAVYWVKWHNKWLYQMQEKWYGETFWSDLNRFIDEVLKNEHFTLHSHFVLFQFQLFLIFFVYPLSFCPLGQIPSTKSSSWNQRFVPRQGRRCPPLWIWQPLLWVLAFLRYLMFLGRKLSLTLQEISRRWGEIPKKNKLPCEFSGKGLI